MIISVFNKETIVKFCRKFKLGSTLLNILIMINSKGKPAPSARAFFVSLNMHEDKKLMPLNIPNNKNIPRLSIIKAFISKSPGNEISDTIIPTSIKSSRSKKIPRMKNIA